MAVDQLNVTIEEPGANGTILVTIVEDPQGPAGDIITALVEEPDTIQVSIMDAPVGPKGEKGDTVVGPQGPIGPAGPAGGGYTHHQDIPAITWIISHGLGFYPNVSTVDSAGTLMVGDVQYIDQNTIFVHFAVPFGGMAFVS